MSILPHFDSVIFKVGEGPYIPSVCKPFFNQQWKLSPSFYAPFVQTFSSITKFTLTIPSSPSFAAPNGESTVPNLSYLTLRFMSKAEKKILGSFFMHRVLFCNFPTQRDNSQPQSSTTTHCPKMHFTLLFYNAPIFGFFLSFLLLFKHLYFLKK